jgi:hypothetical protein
VSATPMIPKRWKHLNRRLAYLSMWYRTAGMKITHGIPPFLHSVANAVSSISMFVYVSYQSTLNCCDYRSFWTLTGSPGLLKAQETQRLAAAYSCTTEQAVYRLAQLRGITPLCGSTDEQHMREAIAVSQLAFDTEHHDYAAADSLIGRRDL